jgi:hypothetical protein
MVKLIIVFISTLPLLYAWPSGAPEGACETFTPQHAGVDPKDLESAEFFIKFKSGSVRRKNLAKLNKKGVMTIKVFLSADSSSSIYMYRRRVAFDFMQFMRGLYLVDTI